MNILDEPGFDPAEQAQLEQTIKAEAPEPEPRAEAVEVQAEVEEAVEEEEKVEPVPTVPLQALNEARHANRELKNQLSEVQKQLQSLQQLKEELETFRKQRTDAEKHQEFTQDPLGALQKDIQSLKQIQEQARTESQQREQETQQTQQLERMVASKVQEFSKNAPDYPEALNHLLQTRANEMQMLGIPQEQIEIAIANESLMLARNAIQTGANPAEIVYNLAKLRGYSPKQAKAMKEEAEKIVSIEKGQKASQTLSNTRGGADGVSLSDIEKMSDEEFDKYWDKEVAGRK